MIAAPPQPVVPLQETAPLMFRVNQVGYPQDGSKRMLAMTKRRIRAARFEVLNSHGRVVLRARAGGPARWNGRYVVYALDFSRLHTSGVYAVRFDGGRSPLVRIASPASLYRPLGQGALAFLQSQRDGPEAIPGPMGRRPAHLGDASATVYRLPRYRNGALAAPPAPTAQHVDVAGGWFDAGDYLKLTETASFADVALYYAARDYSSGVSDPPALLAEARHGSDWLLKMWDQSAGVLYLQVGIGDGTPGERILGDHDVWRLPQFDERGKPRRSSPMWLIAHRPVFAANAPGAPISPNLAGRVAAAFGLCAQVFAHSDPAYAQRCLLAGQSIYDRADTHPRGALTTAVPFAYYPEREWRDDMELGATELYLGTAALEGAEPAGLPHPEAVFYLSPAGYWANAYITAKGSGQDSLNVYDVSALADRDLARILQTPQALYAIEENEAVNVPTSIPALLKDRHDQLALARRLARHEPFGLADPAMPSDTVSHALGYAVQAGLYREMGGGQVFGALGSDQLDWVLGANAWGSSFVVGAGSVYPHCPAAQIPNLSGSLNGRGRILVGTTVDGPTGREGVRQLGAPDGYRRCPRRGRLDPFRAQSGHGLVYLDDVRSSATSEPSDDLAALTLLASAQLAAGA
ncbi:MAG: glycoside hydrolase family 9 protein [Solirubrobacteraceae bacterium]